MSLPWGYGILQLKEDTLSGMSNWYEDTVTNKADTKEEPGSCQKRRTNKTKTSNWQAMVPVNKRPKKAQPELQLFPEAEMGSGTFLSKTQGFGQIPQEIWQAGAITC